MEFTMKYGKGHKTIVLPDEADVTVMEARQLPELDDLARAFDRELDAPLEAARLEGRPQPGLVAIAVPDETRPAPLKVLLPVLLARIFRAWPALDPASVRIVVGGGLHPAPDAAQLGRILPTDLRGCTVISHDALQSPMRHFGVTSRGTPVAINAAYAEADLKLVIGQIDPHQFQGMTGGAKGVVIGCGSAALIQHNHSLMADPAACVGNIGTNPARLDINEAGRMVGIDLAINLCLNPAKRAVALLVGNPDAVLRAGAAYSEQVYGLPFTEPFDIVIASCGGAPKDICLYQAQKGLNLSSQCAVPGGRILLLAACSQGVGDDHYQQYVRRFATPEEQMHEFAEVGFRMGAHKAFLFSRTLIRFTVVIDSDLDDHTLAECHLIRGDAQATVDRWLRETSGDMPPRIAVVPSANTSYFYRSHRE